MRDVQIRRAIGVGLLCDRCEMVPDRRAIAVRSAGAHTDRGGNEIRVAAVWGTVRDRRDIDRCEFGAGALRDCCQFDASYGSSQ